MLLLRLLARLSLWLLVATLGLHAYMATVFREIEPPQSQAYRVGGVADHVHIACSLPRTITISKLIEIVKKESSRWIKDLQSNSKVTF